MEACMKIPGEHIYIYSTSKTDFVTSKLNFASVNGDHLFSMYVKFSKKLVFLNLLVIHLLRANKCPKN